MFKDKIIFSGIVLISVITLIFGYIMYSIIFPKAMEVGIEDNVIVAKCPNCKNLILVKNKKDCCGYSFFDCEHFKKYANRGKVIEVGNKDYEFYKLKYNFYNNGGGDFNVFNEWYKENKDKKYFKYIKSYKILIDEPIYETKMRSYSRSVGKFVHHGYMPYHVIVGYKQVEKDALDIKYDDPKDEKYIKVECSVFEYYCKFISKKEININKNNN